MAHPHLKVHSLGGTMLGVIGGTGLYKLENLKVRSTIESETPFGKPSAPIVVGELGRQTLAFLPRHGLHHQYLPSEINYRANVFALKKLGVRAIVGVSAVGSLREDVAPGELALAEQYFDFTRGRRAGTFFGGGLSAHVSTADPVCAQMVDWIEASARKAEIHLHRGKTYACVEGPRLGTRAESHFLRGAGCDLVGMTNVPEVFLAREAQLPYATICIATDYDCWMEDPSMHAQVDKIMELYASNVARVKAILLAMAEDPFPDVSQWPTRASLKYAVLSSRESLPPEARAMLEVLEC